MGVKNCEKCGESADEAKAFCPACGNPFVAEKERIESSEFDKYAGTVNISKTAYKMMLSELDAEPTESLRSETVPISPREAAKPQNSGNAQPDSQSSNRSVFLFAGLAIILLIAAAAVFVVYIYSR